MDGKCGWFIHTKKSDRHPPCHSCHDDRYEPGKLDIHRFWDECQLASYDRIHIQLAARRVQKNLLKLAKKPESSSSFSGVSRHPLTRLSRFLEFCSHSAASTLARSSSSLFSHMDEQFRMTGRNQNAGLSAVPGLDLNVQIWQAIGLSRPSDPSTLVARVSAAVATEVRQPLRV